RGQPLRGRLELLRVDRCREPHTDNRRQRAPRRRPPPRTNGPLMDTSQRGDVFVIFGITGDLARVMTFRSLYRLEQRKLLDTPIVGVAVDDWTLEQLIERARTSIVATGEQLDPAVFDRLAARFSYVQGDFSDDETYARVGA